jgi:hypothetical protein
MKKREKGISIYLYNSCQRNSMDASVAVVYHLQVTAQVYLSTPKSDNLDNK